MLGSMFYVLCVVDSATGLGGTHIHLPTDYQVKAGKDQDSFFFNGLRRGAKGKESSRPGYIHPYIYVWSLLIARTCHDFGTDNTVDKCTCTTVIVSHCCPF